MKGQNEIFPALIIECGRNLADNAGSGNWLDGKRFGAGASEDDIRSWIESLQ